MPALLVSNLLFIGGIAVGIAFKPLLQGALRATAMLLGIEHNERVESEKKRARRSRQVVELARSYEKSQPNLAAELRAIACRN